MMDKPVFVDYETKIYAAYLNAVSATVWDALGQATNPQEARQFIGAIGEAPTDGSSYARQNAQWVQIQVGNLHNDLTGRSAADAHPISAITNLQTSLDQINTSLSGKAPTSAGTASGTSFSPTGTVAATNVQSAIAEVSGDVTALQATVSGLGSPAASAVTFSPTGTVAATNVQAAIAEVASEKVALSGGTMTGPLTTTALTSNGQIESKATGFKFPDGTVQASAASTPPGAVMDFAMNSAPTGWLSCDGALVSRTTYAALFAAIGTTWGAGDGTTTFQLPDMRGYFRRGAGTNSDGAVSGAFATRQTQAIEPHNHTLTMVGGPGTGGSDGAYRSQTGSPFGAVAGFVGGSQGAETRPRNIAVLTCIKT